MGPGFRNQGKCLALRNLTNYGNPGALSIQPKIPEISVGSSNGTGHFGLVRPEYSGPALKVVHCDRSVGPKCPFPFAKLDVPSTALFYPAYKNKYFPVESEVL